MLAEADCDRHELVRVVQAAVSETLEHKLRALLREELQHVPRQPSKVKACFVQAAEQPKPKPDPRHEDTPDWTRRHVRAYSRYTDEERESERDIQKKEPSGSWAPQSFDKVSPQPTDSSVGAEGHFAGVLCSQGDNHAGCQEPLPQNKGADGGQLPASPSSSDNEQTDLGAPAPSRSSIMAVNRYFSDVATGVRGSIFSRMASRTPAMLDRPNLTESARKLVTSPRFEFVVCLIILVNAMTLGAQTDYMARHQSNEVPAAYAYIESCLCVVFVLELALRLGVFRWRFFVRTGWQWNLFDCVVVGVQIVEQIMAIRFAGSGQFVNNFSSARVMRILRLIRVLRVARVLQGIAELRILVVSILSSMRALVWTMLLLLLIIYTLGIYLTQLVSDHMIMHPDGPANDELSKYFGSMSKTMFVMFMSVTGGADWGAFCDPLIAEVSPLVALVFTVYIAFTVLAMLNVVTGVFVESVLKSQASDRDMVMVNNARELFMTLDGGLQSTMSWDAFQSKLQEPQMIEFFKFIDVDPSDAKGLFRLLDLDNSGGLSAEEFLNGAIRLRGNAKSLDVALLIQEVKKISTDMM